MSVQPDLLKRIQEDKNAEYEVVLTIVGDNVPQSVESRLTEILGGDHTYSGRLTGNEILSLSNDPNVSSIEADTEQYAFDD